MQRVWGANPGSGLEEAVPLSRSVLHYVIPYKRTYKTSQINSLLSWDTTTTSKDTFSRWILPPKMEDGSYQLKVSNEYTF